MQRSAENITATMKLVSPSGDYSVPGHLVQPPKLIEAAGLDGRFPGECRSFPGFRALGLQEANGGNGPVVVGPGVDHGCGYLNIQAAGSGQTYTVGPSDLTLDDGGTPVVLSFTTYPTVQNLVDYINASVANFTAAVRGSYGTEASTDLQPTAELACAETPSWTTLWTLNWKYFKPALPVWGLPDTTAWWYNFWPRIRFIKGMELQKAAGSSQTVTGFVVMCPWTGAYKETMQPTDNKGLPYGYVAVGFEEYWFRKRTLVMLVYWDDEPYPHPHLAAEKVPAGWRVRVLTGSDRDWTTYPGTYRIAASGSNTLDCSSWGRFGYLVNPHASLTIYASGGAPPNSETYPPTAFVHSAWAHWGAPYDANAEAGYDHTVSDCIVLYWDATYHYVRVRSMGDALSTDPDWVAGESHRTTTGRIQSTGQASPSENFEYGYTFMNSATGQRSEYVGEAYTCTTSTKREVVRPLSVPIEAWDKFDTVELWRSNPAIIEGLLYRESTHAMGTLPAYDAGIDADTTHRSMWLSWGATKVAATTSWITGTLESGGDIAREDWVSEGLTNGALRLQRPYPGVYEFRSPPPDGTSRILVESDVAFINADTAEDADDISSDYDAADIFEPPWVPTRLRWSSLVLPRPENFGDLDETWAPDRAAGMTHGFEFVGGTLFVVGNRSIVSARRMGDRLDVNSVGSGLHPVSRYAYCSGGNELFVLAPDGLYQISPAQNSINPINALNEVLLSPTGWGSELGSCYHAHYPRIGMQYDDVGSCLFVWNLRRLEAYVWWRRTGQVTKLDGFNWQMSCRGSAPETVGDPKTYSFSTAPIRRTAPKRAFFAWECGLERGVADLDDQGDGWHVDRPWDLFYSDLTPASAAADSDNPVGSGYTMHGDTGYLTKQGGGDFVEDILSGTVGKTESFTYGSQAHYVVVRYTTNEPSADAAEDVRQRLTGALMYLRTAAGTIKRSTIRDVLKYSSGGTYGFKFLLDESMDGDATFWAAVTGARYTIGPIVVRVIRPLLRGIPGNEGESLGLKSVIGGAVDCDLIATRYLGSSYVTPQLPTTQVFAVGYTDRSSAISDTSILPTVVSAADLFAERLPPLDTYATPQIVWTRRLVEVARRGFTFSRKLSEAGFKLPFTGDDVTVGVEIYNSGNLIALTGLSVTYNALPSRRRA